LKSERTSSLVTTRLSSMKQRILPHQIPIFKQKKRLFVYRSHLALTNYSFVLDEIDDKSPSELQVARILALYLSGEDAEKAKGLLNEFVKRPVISDLAGHYLLIAAALFYFHEGDLEEALRFAFKSASLEGKALIAQIYLHMNRYDLAEKEVKQMQQIDDDAIITQLAQAWVYACMGSEKANQASYIFEELIEKYGATNLLLNGQAICKMGCGQFVEAEPLLLQALEKSNNDKNTLISLTVCLRHLNKPVDVINRKLKQVRSLAGPPHPWISELDHQEMMFDKAASRYKV